MMNKNYDEQKNCMLKSSFVLEIEPFSFFDDVIDDDYLAAV